jgi:hypothetical protein
MFHFTFLVNSVEEVEDDFGFLADCFEEGEEYEYDHNADCYCWYDEEHEAWYWLNEETGEWLLVEDDEADWGDDEEEYEDEEEECEEA